MNIIDFNKKKKEKKYTVVSLFAGAGGLDLGFDQQGFKVLWANDIDKDACDTHRLWCSTRPMACYYDRHSKRFGYETA